MFKKNINYLILSSISFSILGCSVPGSNYESGYIRLGFKFPQKQGFSLKTIPATTEKVEIKITGKDIPANNPLIKNITRSGNESEIKVKLEEVPSGPKKIEVKAFDKDVNVVAEGSADIEVRKGELSSVTIELKVKEILKKLKLVLNNYPSGGTVALAEIKPENEDSVFKQITEKEINFDNITHGNTKVRAVVFNDDATPLAFISTNINTKGAESFNLDLGRVSLPEVTDLTSGGSSTLTEALDNVLIKFKNNNTPELGNVGIKVNGTLRDFTPGIPFCVNPGDKLDFNIDASDPDKDKINFFWGKTRTVGATEQGKFIMQLQPDRGPNFSWTLGSIPEGDYAVGFLMTDKKSYNGPVSIPFYVRIKTCS